MEVGNMSRLATWVARSDEALIAYVNRHWKCRVLDLLLPRFTHLGGATATIGFLVAWYICSEEDTEMWALTGLLALGVSHLIVQILKWLLPRIRPHLKHEHLHSFPNSLTDYSFPSGHTTAAFSVAMTFCLYDATLTYLFIPIAIMVGYSRIYLALHYPTDVLIGSVIGSLTAYAFVETLPF
ncbi:undecaprenyl-diphosphatase [Croceifilum oryzae]|uniref:Undecaprenyl-diphosphatase n=1 Tax=Croceifilum oryzae TaxID=1553429 RepID=A0AAJ1TKG0_9BACL|nr:phosphatase PAP2 family protein [Croceifilum oryzae]MDQ0416341.1 undecaprenyl-diphosphatase [Croceifilum oryzae]